MCYDLIVIDRSDSNQKQLGLTLKFMFKISKWKAQQIYFERAQQISKLPWINDLVSNPTINNNKSFKLLMEKTLLKKIKAGQMVYGTCIASTAPTWPAIAKRAGLDFVFLDTEHIPLERMEIARMCQTYGAMGIAPIVRIPSPDPYRACQMMDAGAEGVVAPYLENVSQVKELVGALKYRPLKGELLDRALENPEKVEKSLKLYLSKWNEGNICVANIESVPALNKLEELLSVPGLDAVFIGPHDLSISLGLPEQYDHPVFEEAVKKIIRISKGNGLAVGIHFSESPERQLRWMKEGINLIIHSSDLAMFSQRLQQDGQIIRTAAGEKTGTFPNEGEVV
jgi:4-hydroxy-2-oxoheptanedioate aldolase